MGADTLLGNDVYNKNGENLGDIKEFMIDMASAKVVYAVLSFGGLLGEGSPEGRTGLRQGPLAFDARPHLGQRGAQVLRHNVQRRMTSCGA